MARFNSQEHIDTIQKGIVPKIYVNIYREIKQIVEKELAQDSEKTLTILDLGSGTGILSYLVQKLSSRVLVISFDESKSNAEKAKEIGIDTFTTRIDNKSLDSILSLLGGVDIIIARRILPELYSTDQNMLDEILNKIHERGIIIVGEARVASHRTVHALGKLELETSYAQRNSQRSVIIKGNVYIIN